MTRYKCIVQYDGTNYSGYQIQPDKITVQGEIERALSVMTKGTVIKIVGSGRTDAGVHSIGQVIHFDYPKTVPAENMQRALNSLLDEAIRIVKVNIVDEYFHARYNAIGKKYQYRVNVSPIADPFKRLYTLHHPYPIDLARVNEALSEVIGEHDFTSFCARKSGKEDKVRTVYEAFAEYDEAQGELVFTFRGNGFLYNMVRILVGTLLQIGDGRRPVQDMKRIIAAKDRQQAGPTAAARGLYLMEVYYHKDGRNTNGRKFLF